MRTVETHKVEALYRDAFRQFNGTEHREKLLAKMAEKLSEAFTSSRY